MIWGISGKMGSGKTTVAKILCEHDTRLRRVSFANSLKRLIYDHYKEYLHDKVDDFKSEDFKTIYIEWVLPLEMKELPIPLLKQKYLDEINGKMKQWGAGRIASMLQCLGEAFRQENPDYWIEVHKRQAFQFQIIDDVRYKNEFKYLRHCGARLVRVISTDTNVGSRANGRSFEHKSENDLDDIPLTEWDRVIFISPEESIEEIKLKVKELLLD